MKRREKIARSLVRRVGACYDRSYKAYFRKNEYLAWKEARQAKRRKWQLKLAIYLDSDNAVEQMAREGWWG